MFILNCVLCCLITSASPKQEMQGTKKPAAAKKSSALPQGSLRVAVLDVDLVVEQSMWVKWLQESANKEFRELAKKINEKRERYKALLVSADMLVKDSTEYGMMLAEIDGLKTEINTATAVRNRQMNKKSASSMVSIFREIRETVRRYAKQQGIVLVLKKFATKPFRKDRLQEELSRIQAMSVIFAADSLDITKSIVNLLDAAHPADVLSARAAEAAKKAAAKKAAKEAAGRKSSSGGSLDSGNGKKK